MAASFAVDVHPEGYGAGPISNAQFAELMKFPWRRRW